MATAFVKGRSDMSEPLAYLNGHFLPASQAHLTVYDAGVVLGATVTELVRTFQHELFHLEAHLDRLADSLHYVRFDIGMTMPELAAVVRDLVDRNAKLI